MKRRKNGRRSITDSDWFKSVLQDFHGLTELQKRGVNPVNVTLPSGRFLHNPAKRTVKSSDRWAKQQVDNAKAASADWLDGIKNPARDPIAAGVDAAKKWADKLTTAIREGRFEKGLKKSSLSEIQQIATNVGTGAYETGLEARRQKVARVVGELQPLVQSVSDAIQALPDASDSDREKRLVSARRLMLEAGKKRRG